MTVLINVLKFFMQKHLENSNCVHTIRSEGDTNNVSLSYEVYRYGL